MKLFNRIKDNTFKLDENVSWDLVDKAQQISKQRNDMKHQHLHKKFGDYKIKKAKLSKYPTINLVLEDNTEVACKIIDMGSIFNTKKLDYFEYPIPWGNEC